MKHLYGILTHTLSSVYQDSSDKSRQTSQLLLGETCIIKTERNNFFYIENDSDKHCGWVNKNAFTILSKIEFERLQNRYDYRVASPIAKIIDTENQTQLYIPLGSPIVDYDEHNNSLTIAKRKYLIGRNDLMQTSETSLVNIEEKALSLLHTPFMYGGKSIMGIDKANFTQLIFSLCGYIIPRALNKQTKVGVPVYSTEQLRSGDILFIKTNELSIDPYIYLKDDILIGVEDKVRIFNLRELEKLTCEKIIRRLI